ncbi:MAG: hypothetical protein WB347_20385 [Terriglobales bacterium]
MITEGISVIGFFSVAGDAGAVLDKQARRQPSSSPQSFSLCLFM